MRRKTFGPAAAILQLALICSTHSRAQSSPQSLPQSFSADIVSRDAGGAALGAAARLHAANHAVRIEMPGLEDYFFISDADMGSSVVVRPAQRAYMDARQSTPLTRIFVWVDPKNPCRQWRAAAATAGLPSSDWRCEPIEHAGLDQREIVEYSVVTSDRQTSHAWVDATIGFPVKWQASDGKLFVLENIFFQAQPASLFSIPPHLRKLDPQALLERIRRSDVWAESPDKSP